LVFEEYFRGHNQSSIDDVASVTKSITSIAIGIAIEQGFIKGPDQYLSDLLPSYADIINADPLKKKLQLWHLLTMTSGIDWDEKTYPYGNLKNDATKMERSPDPVRFILNRTVIRESGTQFQYSGANSMLLSAILQEATGMPLVDFANSNLFAPLGIRRYRWDAYPDGHTNTDGGLSLRPRDMAKIGQLMLNKGQWNDVQIISPEWVSESTQAHTTVMPGIRYGYQWWRETQPILLESVEPYFAAGYGGQLITVYPDQNMIIIVTGQTAKHDENISRFIYLRNKYLLPAAISASLSKIILWSWYTLTLGGLVALVIEVAKGNLLGFGWSTCWLLIGALFGPLGLIVYVLSYRNRQTVKASGWKALGIATFLAAGTIFGIILLTLYQTLFLPDGSVFLLVVPVSFLVNHSW
jgi:CubicO group peptidase (beta-lactamase class C family)